MGIRNRGEVCLSRSFHRAHSPAIQFLVRYVMPEHKPMGKDRSQSKEAVIAAIQDVARQLGHVPTAREFRPLGRVSLWQVTGRFGTYRNALRAAGLQPSQRGVKVEA